MAARISTAELRLGMFVRKLGTSWLNHPFLRNSFRLTDPADIKAILDAGITEAWIDEEDLQTQQERKTERAIDSGRRTAPISSNHNDPSVSMESEIGRAKKICSVAKEQVASMFADVRLGKAVDPDTTVPLVMEISNSIQRNSAALISVARLKTHDDYTYMHSVAVCALMISLAKQVALDEQQTLMAGVAGLMHDLGKAKMPLEVLNKSGKLTDAEFDIMKQHPAAGAEILRAGGAPIEAQDVALHHHEKMNGRGYPHGLAGEQISLLARMGAICDVYDAVTSERPYKHAWDPAYSIAQMAKWEGHFDKRLFTAFVKTIGIYPVGSLVRLASERLAIVVEPGIKSLLTPKVRVFFDARSNKTIPIQTIDLSQADCGDSIAGLEDHAKWGFKKFRNLDEIWLG